MPIIVKDYHWEETPKTVAVSVPLKGVKKEKVDIFSTEELVKVSFPPYFFEVILFKPVLEGESVARIENGMILFKLVKQTEELWGQLCSDVMDDKETYKTKKEEILVKAQQKMEEKQKEMNEMKREREKHALRKAMDLDAEERQRIESIKEAEKKRATEELEKWKEEQRNAALKEKRVLEEEARKQQEIKEAEVRRQRLLEKANKKANIFENGNSTDGVRESGKISVTFTPRVFPTASRESTKPLEDEWLKKQAEAQRVADIDDANFDTVN